ncbi:hypothetical protein ACFL1X_05290 [Candidatus Hydrogenedentota bacterium]
MEAIFIDIFNVVSATFGAVTRFFLDMSVGMTALIGVYYMLADQALDSFVFQNWLSD